VRLGTKALQAPARVLASFKAHRRVDEQEGMMKLTLLSLGAALLFAGCATHPITRTFDAKSPIPIASVVLVPAGYDMIYVSGMLAENLAPAGQPADFGADTKTQALSVLKKLKAALAKEGASFADVTTVRVFLVGDAKLGGKMDFAGFNEAFRTEFGNDAQPHRPTRTVVQVVALPAPGALVEVDLIAARKAPK
jgi:enamine deaminase RidA (YjgF/YER057c/UK114 family)